MIALRPEALAWLARWRGLALAAGLGLGGLALFAPGAALGAPIPAALLLATTGLSLWLARDAMTRLRLARQGGAGVVSIAEGQIGYFGPETGGLIDLDALGSIEIDGAGHWLLRAPGAPPLRIPLAAAGADALPDTFAALPGFSAARAADAATGGVHTLVWRRRSEGPPGTGVLASASRGPYISHQHNPEDGR